MKKVFLCLIITAVLFACKKDNTNTINNFKGDWKGTYRSAEDSGTFDVMIDENGKAAGSVTSNVFSETFQLTGIVNSNGEIALTFGSATSGGTFTGKMNKTTASGTWVNKMTTPNYSGTWEGKKQ